MDETRLKQLQEIADLIINTSAEIDAINRAAAVLSERFGTDVEPLIDCLIQHLSALENRLDAAQNNPIFCELW